MILYICGLWYRQIHVYINTMGSFTLGLHLNPYYKVYKMSIMLTLEDRYYINMYSRQLPCTVSLRFTIDQFHQQIEITPSEVEIYEISTDPSTGKFICNDASYVVSYDKFPTQVIDAMRRYVDLLSNSKNEDNVLLQNILKYFSKVI